MLKERIRLKLGSIKNQLIIFLIAFAACLSLKEKDIGFFYAILIAVVSATTADCVLTYLRDKRFSLSSSPVITGLIIGYLLDSRQHWWLIALVSLLAILSKYLIRINKRHIFNPAAFGVFFGMILLGVQTQWRATFIWQILFPFGLYFSFKIRKMELLIGYAVTALSLFAIQGLIQKVPLANIFGYLSYFYIFIMLIEPKTSPSKRAVKFIFGIEAAILIFVFTQAGVRFDAELAALLISNASVPFLNKLHKQKGGV